MKIQQFLEHHGIQRNPFAEEDAQTDPVFKDFCIESTFHPTWDKVYGDPHEPSTSIVLGEKGSGKTAMRLQVARHLQQWNLAHPERKLFVVHYDDFNPFLDRFADHFGRRRPKRVVASWRLWDHMDAILCLAVTGLIDRTLEVRSPSQHVDSLIDSQDLKALDSHQARDLLLLSAFYDQSLSETYKGRWHRLRKQLSFFSWKAYWDIALGIGGSVGLIAILIILGSAGIISSLNPLWFYVILFLLLWVPRLWRTARMFWVCWGVTRHMRVGKHSINAMRQVLMHLSTNELEAQPIPNKDRTDDRYELLAKLQSILKTLSFDGMIVLIDRVDEPHLINGSAELMKLLIWPMLDNKFLKHPGLGIKLMLPIELNRFLDREDQDFYQRARLDKQNLIADFRWTGEALFDVTNARIKACSAKDQSPSLRNLVDESVSDQRLMEALRTMRVPRHLFKFLYRLLVAHCNAFTDAEPRWKISSETFESTLAVFLKEQEPYGRGEYEKG